MRPLSLEIEGIRSFRVAQKIDFTDLSFFAILGDTGAGKSSILEAMSYALFNSPTWLDKGVKDLMTTGASSMRVKFTFRVEGKVCTITRLTPRAGAAQHLLEYAGDPPARCDSDGAVSHFVRERLRLERETFMKTVMLPQGRFAELLLMKPADRSTFLRDVLGLQVIETMAEAVRIPREETASRRDSLRAVRKELPQNPADALEEARNSAEAATAALVSIDAAMSTLAEMSSAIEHQRTALAETEASRLKVVAGMSAANDLRILRNDDAQLRAVIATRAREEANADTKRTATRAMIARRRASGTDAAALRAILSDLKRLAELADRLAGAQATQGDVQRRITAIRATLEADEKHAQTCRERDRSVEADLANARADVEERRDWMTAASFAANAIVTATAERAAAKTAAADAEEYVLAAEAAASAAAATLRERNLIFDERTADMESARRVDSAAHAAAGLRVGDTCPVCSRTLPKDFAAPSSPKLAEIERLHKAATKERDQSQREYANADATRHQASEALAKRRQALDDRATALAEAIRASAAYALSANLEDNARRLRVEAEKLTNAQDVLKALEQTHREVRANRGLAERTEADETATLRAAIDRLDDVKRDIESLMDRIERTREALPEANRPAADSSQAEIDAISGHLSSTLAEAESVENSLAADERRFSDAAAEHNKATEAWKRTVETPRREALARLRPVISEILAPQGFTSDVPVPDGEPEVFAAFEDALAEALASVDEQLGSAAASAAVRLGEAETTLNAFFEKHGVENSKALQSVRDGRLSAVALATHAVETAQENVERAAVLDRRIAVIEPVAEVFSELADSLTPGQFAKFIVERKQRDLLRVGTTILGRMTRDRYGFSDGLGIVDRSINQERKAHTLSGGETFLASLALSLALVEISERSGVRFESLFLDEGFGTLDPAAFEQALTELEHQVSQGRMIAVITHVARVREFIDDVLRVEKTADGSEVFLEQTASAA